MFVIPRHALRFEDDVDRLWIRQPCLLLKGSLEIWPTRAAICFLRKPRVELPRGRVANQIRH